MIPGLIRIKTAGRRKPRASGDDPDLRRIETAIAQ